MEETEVLKNVKRKNEKGVEELILKELEKDFNWKEKIIFKLPIVRKITLNSYRTGIKAGFNWNSNMFIKPGVPVSAPEEE